MSSPFPGMDPFLEGPAYWPDFHFRFINCWAEAIADQLPAEYEANLGERVYLLEVDPDVRKLINPDVSVSGTKMSGRSVPTEAASVATLEPVTIPLQILEGPREAYIEILHGPDRDLVAVLELLSPANKHEPGRTEYLVKRDAVARQNVHLVQLDLMFGGAALTPCKAVTDGRLLLSAGARGAASRLPGVLLEPVRTASPAAGPSAAPARRPPHRPGQGVFHSLRPRPISTPAALSQAVPGTALG